MHQNAISSKKLFFFLGSGPIPDPFPAGKGYPLPTHHPSPPPSLVDPPYVPQYFSQIYATGCQSSLWFR